MDNKKVIVIVGPTASGKSDLAQSLAVKLDGEVVSADSMQIYRSMDIGTGKVLECNRAVPHHLLDILDPGESFSAAVFQNMARECFTSISERGKQPILAGGTGFYVRAAIDDYTFSEGDQDDNPVRKKFEDYASSHDKKELWELLRSKDERSANVIEVNDSKRVIRALELNERGESYFENKNKLSDIKEKVPSIWIGLSVDRDILADRISHRTDNMIECGLIDEVKALMDAGFESALTSPKAIGYKEIVSYLKGETSLERAIQDIKTNTRRYAKRQRTWFRSEGRIHWIDANNFDKTSMLEDAMQIIEDNCN